MNLSITPCYQVVFHVQLQSDKLRGWTGESYTADESTSTPDLNFLDAVNRALFYVVCFLIVCHIGSFLYELSVRARCRRWATLERFTAMSGVRLGLHGCGMLWMVTALWRLPMLLQDDSLPFSYNSEVFRHTLCQLQPVLSQGVGEPLCLLFSLFAFTHLNGLSEASEDKTLHRTLAARWRLYQQTHPNLGICFHATLACLPVTIAHILVVLSPNFPSTREWVETSIGSSLVKAWDTGDRSGCGNTSSG
ncbi:hypothetical protein CYMTET_28420, partial [Cymbomonas tetramitiformis]